MTRGKSYLRALFAILGCAAMVSGDAGGLTQGDGKTGMTAGAGRALVWGGDRNTAQPAATSSLTVTRHGGGAGTVTANVGAINCAAVCSASYDEGTVVTLTATPAAGSQFTGWLGPCAGSGKCQVRVEGPATVSATFAASLLGAPRLDIDGSSHCDLLTDGLLVMRRLFGMSSSPLLHDVVAQRATRTTPTEIDDYLADMGPALDVDGDGHADPLTDGLLILRYLHGRRGPALIAGAIAPGAARKTAAGVEAQIAKLCLPLPPPTVFTILLENHDYAEIVGSPNAPYLNALIDRYGLATNYMDAGTHPSLPNYLYLISGSVQNASGTNADPTVAPHFPVAADNLGNQFQKAGIAWRSYQESMGTPCRLSRFGNYVPRHNPFLYFANIQNGANGLCAATNRDYGEFAGDLAAGTYRYMWITPNLLNDGHDGPTPAASLRASDTWLAAEIPKILASPAFKAGGVIFVTWDEGVGRKGNSSHHVPMIVISPRIKSAGMKSGRAYNHASYLATVQDIFGLPRLGAARTADNMMEFFAP